MMSFDVSLNWTILLPPGLPCAKKAAEDLAVYIAVLNGSQKPLPLINAHEGQIDAETAVIVLNSYNREPQQNGFSWRAGKERVEIFGESERGLCNGIYSFLAALGISWPVSGQEKLPLPKNCLFPLAVSSVHEPSLPLRRLVIQGKKPLKNLLKNSNGFAAWAARQRYDAVVVPLTAFASGTARLKLKQFRQFALEYGISLEAGGRDLSSLLPRKLFFFHKDFFRMEEGKRKNDCHFCPTNTGAIARIGIEAEKLFRAAEGINTFHLWPCKEAWCSCPSCRAFTAAEQNRIAVNIAADILAAVNPAAVITYFEKSGEEANIPLRKNLVRMEELP